MDNKISVKELNEILQNKQLSETETFSEIDIVFIAGLFLLYMKNKQKLPSISFKLDEKSGRREIHKSYFRQLRELYNVDYNDIIDAFPNIEPSNKYKPDSYSTSFAPPIYITRDTIDYFFGNERGNENNIIVLKNKYIGKIESLQNNTEEIKYFKQHNSIIKDLRVSSPIHTFIFSVAYNKIQPFVNTKDKGFDSPTIAIKQLWKFTQEYVRGLYELAKNIVEHSGLGENDGQGMITIRAYSGKDNNKVLETYVFDYGTTGILNKLEGYTSNLRTHYFKELAKENLSASEKEWLKNMLNCYEEDLKKLRSNYKLSNLIIPPKTEDQELQQQIFRDIAHFGLRKFFQLVKRYNGEMYLATHGNYFILDDNESEIKNKTIDFTGTSYYFQIPFDAKKIKQTEITSVLQSNLTTTFGSTTALQELHKIRHLVISTDNPDNVKQCIEKENMKFLEREIWQDVIFDFKLKLQIKEKKDVSELYKYFENLSEINNVSIQYLAIDLENVINDTSILLRFLSHLTARYEYPFIIYNLSNELYGEVISDIENFYNVRNTQNIKSATYWHEDRAILLFTKTKEKNFYFADILYGKDENDFLLANKIINNTFPNSKTILLEKEKEKEKETTSEYSSRFTRNKNLHRFFNDKLLLPFDTILTNNAPLFISNLSTILTNELPKTDDFTYSDLNSYIEKNSGYHISKTHFKIGGKIHSEDFYYAKGLFQNSFYTSRLAMYLANNLADEITRLKIKNLTIIGYEMYSELLLSLIKNFLEDRLEVTVNHFIAQDENGNLHFKPKINFEDYIKKIYKEENSQAVIIVPIASTGSTAKKILEAIKDSIVQHATKRMLFDEARKEAKQMNLLNTFYNILWAKPVNNSNFGLVVDSIKIIDQEKEIKQRSIIELPTTWHTLDKCKLCYGIDDSNNKVATLSLFETDKSSLTPAIVFGNPIGKKQTSDKDIRYVDFDKVDFSDSLKYKTTFRNNEFLLYSTDTEKLIENKNNKSTIVNWLKSIKKTLLDKKDGVIVISDKIIIISPCHETNSSFINLVNKYVFNSAATIIHYQANVDFAENFKKMNSQTLSNSNTKIFYVDDSLISGKHFFNLFDLVRSSKDISMFDGTIVLSDKSAAFTHNRIVRWSKFMFSFVSYNQPPSISLSEQRPLEYERQRYKSLSNITLHDAIIKTFNQKAEKLSPENSPNKNATERHLRLFEATHMIYEYFSKHENDTDFEIDNEGFVNFKNNTDKKENDNAKIKVLSQYPFILYKPLREKTFEWHKKLLSRSLEQINNMDEKLAINEHEYFNIFTPFKLLIRRAVFLGNYQIIEQDFLTAILKLFKKINQYSHEQETKEQSLFNPKLSEEIEKNLNDFPIFLLSNYLEMTQKNGWAAIRLIENIRNTERLENEFLNGVSLSNQFYRMLQIETAVVVDDYVKMIEKELHFKWRDMYKSESEQKNDDSEKKTNNKLITSNVYIRRFFITNRKKIVDKINKFEIAKVFVSGSFKDKQIEYAPIENYLWIKQVIFNDTIDKNSFLSSNINYQTKIDNILEKMEGLFSFKNIQSFFIVTDNEQTPYVLYDKESVLQNLEEEYHSNKSIIEKAITLKDIEKKVLSDEEQKEFENLNKLKFLEIFKFLYGMPDMQHFAVETIKEYEKDGDNWNDCYNDKYQPKIEFLPDSQYLLLIRLSNLNEDENFVTSGMLGFYGKEPLYNKSASILPKQLLMLLRRNMNEFIEKHHKNDEFSKLREEEIRNRYAYLAGHGRKMLQDLIENGDCYELFTDIVGTINKLQYVFSTERLVEKRKKILKEGFPYEKDGDISSIIEEMAEIIYKTPIIENKVELEKEVQISEESKKILNNFSFNHKLLKFIMFELLVNAKKNRYHFIDDDKRTDEDKKKNEVNISIKQVKTNLVIEITGTGAKFDMVMKEKINNINSHVKDKNKYEISSGIELMRDVIELINHDNSVFIPEPEKITTMKYLNKVKVTLNEMNSEY